MPFANEADKADARGARRQRLARISSIASVLAKLVTAGTSLVTVPLTLHHLGSERFGLWMTIGSLVALLSFADFGLGNGLVNAVSEALGKDDRTAARRLISNALIMLSVVAVGTIVVLLPIAWVVDWASFFLLESDLAVSETPLALSVFALCFAFNVVGGVAQRAQLALQYGYLNALSNGSGALLGLLGVLLVIWLGGGLPWLVLALLGAPVATNLLIGIWFFMFYQRDLLPRFGDLNFGVMTRLISIGALFFLLQFAAAISYASDNVIGARFVGVTAVGEFAAAAKLFGVLTFLVAAILAPLWPAYAEAIARGDLRWVRSTLRRSTLQILTLTLVGSALMVVFFDTLMQAWLRQQPPISIWLVLGLAGWTVVGAVGNCVAIFLNGALIIREQVILASTFSLSCITLKILLTEQFGLTALPWVTTILYIFIVIIPYFLILPQIMRRLDAKSRHTLSSTANTFSQRL
jgi:O-antigen/teichoic acid export membrane protein